MQLCIEVISTGARPAKDCAAGRNCNPSASGPTRQSLSMKVADWPVLGVPKSAALLSKHPDRRPGSPGAKGPFQHPPSVLAAALPTTPAETSRPKTSSKTQANDGFSYSSSGQ